MGRIFDWDPVKARRNAITHGISFKVATDVFFDLDAVWFEDMAHSTTDEQRHLVIGQSRKGILIVGFTERPPATRIITARRADQEERRLYEDQKD